MNLDSVTRMIGSIIISSAIMSIPVLCVLSFVFDWWYLFKLILAWGTAVEVAALAMVIYRKG